MNERTAVLDHSRVLNPDVPDRQGTKKKPPFLPLRHVPTRAAATPPLLILWGTT